MVQDPRLDTVMESGANFNTAIHEFRSFYKAYTTKDWVRPEHTFGEVAEPPVGTGLGLEDGDNHWTDRWESCHQEQ